MVKIVYKDKDDGSELGCVEFKDLSQVLIPDFKHNKHDVFLRNTFKTKTNVPLWKIVSLDIKGNIIEIVLESKFPPDSLGEYARKQLKKPATILRSKQFQLVEVEFGFQQDVFDGISRTRNESSCIALMPGELHKKRPCVVIHCEDEKAQVLPLTTQGDDKNPKQMSVSQESFSGLSKRYTASDSHILLSMMQTVSVFRIFPMKNQQGNYSNNYSSNKLSTKDKALLNNLLAQNYAKQTFDELSNSQRQLDDLKNEKAKLLNTLNRYKVDSKSLEDQSKEYYDYLTKLSLYVDIEFDDFEHLKKQIDAL